MISSLVVLLFGLGFSAEDGEEVDVVVGNNTLGVKTDKTICLLMAFTKLDIEVRGPQNRTYLSENYNLSSIKWFSKRSWCNQKNNTVQKLSLNIENNPLDFFFTLNVPKKTYNMSSVKFTAENPDQFNNTAIRLGSQAGYIPDLKIKPLSKNLDQSFECKFRYHMRFNFTKPEDVEVALKIQNLRFSAFRKSNSTEFQTKNKIYCPPPSKNNKPGNDVVPIAVGSVLTGCLVVSLVGYLVIRSRRT